MPVCRSRSSLVRELGNTKRLMPLESLPSPLRRTDGVGDRERFRF